VDVTSTSTVSFNLADGQLVEAEVQRSPRVRVTRIQLGVDRPLRVIVPDGASDDFAIEALISKRDWVRRKLREVATTAATGGLALDRPGVVWRHGVALPMRSADTPHARIRDGELEVPKDAAAVAGAVGRWYRRAAADYLRAVLAEEASRLGYEPASVAVRDQRTRWGSCSRAGAVSLNWRLFIAPEEVARYVAIHELVHLKVPNHSKLFWNTLAAASPGWQVQARWLRDHGNELRRYALPDTAPTSPSSSGL
jgi:predicted metal-dependent hydrolase